MRVTPAADAHGTFTHAWDADGAPALPCVDAMSQAPCGTALPLAPQLLPPLLLQALLEQTHGRDLMQAHDELMQVGRDPGGCVEAQAVHPGTRRSRLHGQHGGSWHGMCFASVGRV